MRYTSFMKGFTAFCLLAFLARPAAAATTATYNVSIDTASLVGHPAGPFSLSLALTDGSGLGNGNNTVTLTNVDFGGGSASGNPGTFGGVTGWLETAVTMTDTTSQGLFSESFAPGSALHFSLTVTLADEGDGIPDRISIFIVDRFGDRVPTLSPGSDAVFGMDLGWKAGPPQVFASDATRQPQAGAPFTMAAPTVTTVCASDVTAALNVVRGGFVYNPGTGLFSQTVKLTNSSSASIAGPIYLAIDQLSSVATITNPSGATACAAPLDRVTVGVTSDGLAPGASVTLLLLFSNPTRGAMSYNVRVLAGSSAR